MTALLLEHTLRVSALSLAGLALLAIGRGMSAAARHALLTVTLVCSLALPAASSLLPEWSALPWLPGIGNGSKPLESPAVTEQLAFAPVIGSSSQVTTTAKARAAAPRLGRDEVLATIYLTGSAVSLGLLLFGLFRLTRLRAHASPVSGAWADVAEAQARRLGLRSPMLLASRDQTGLLAWGIRRPVVLLPLHARDWSTDRMRLVLTHEFAHLRRGDWAVQVGSEVLRALQWFNPLVWLLCARLRRESELACDDEVLAQEMDGVAYAEHLVEIARGCVARQQRWLPAPAMARPSTLRRRITAMLDPTLPRRSPRVAWLAPAAVLVCCFLGLAGLRAQSFASVSGTAYDQTGALMPGVTITLSNEANATRHEVKSDGAGRFQAVGLAPGDYTLEAKIVGFGDLREPLTLVAGQQLLRDLNMTVGTLEEHIRVTPGAPARQMSASEVEALVEKARARVAARVSECKPGAVGGNILVPRKLRDVRPEYPVRADGSRITGTVVLQTLIDTDGSVAEAVAVSPAEPELEQAAIEAVRQWQFSQTLLNCSPIQVRMTATIEFANASPR